MKLCFKAKPRHLCYCIIYSLVCGENLRQSHIDQYVFVRPVLPLGFYLCLDNSCLMLTPCIHVSQAVCKRGHVQEKRKLVVSIKLYCFHFRLN